jgi:hypothetical protein
VGQENGRTAANQKGNNHSHGTALLNKGQCFCCGLVSDLKLKTSFCTQWILIAARHAVIGGVPCLGTFVGFANFIHYRAPSRAAFRVIAAK